MSSFNIDAMHNIGKRMEDAIEKHIKRHKMTRNQIATELGISRNTLRSYLDGATSPDYAFLYNFSKMFGVSIDYLIFGDNLEIKDFHLVSLINKLTAEQRNAFLLLIRSMVK